MARSDVLTLIAVSLLGTALFLTQRNLTQARADYARVQEIPVVIGSDAYPACQWRGTVGQLAVGFDLRPDLTNALLRMAFVCEQTYRRLNSLNRAPTCTTPENCA